MKLSYEDIAPKLLNRSVERPNKSGRGTTSGHAAGEPFAKDVYQFLKELYPKQIFLQYEFLNDLYRLNPTVISAQDRFALFQSPTVMFLLNRGERETAAWSPEHIFEEKQNDTADIIFHSDNYFDLIDVKTTNQNKEGQPPNIISAYKLAKACAIMIDNNDYEAFDIHYISIDWEENQTDLISQEVHYADLFKETPSNLYINWAAALQIQFFVKKLKQDWKGTRENWARAYITHFVESAIRRCKKMKDDYVSPFIKYISDKRVIAQAVWLENALNHGLKEDFNGRVQ